MKSLSIFVFILVIYLNLSAQTDESVKKNYQNAFNELISLQKNPDTISFTKAVYITENAYYNGQLEFGSFINGIRLLAHYSNIYSTKYRLSYKANDKSKIALYGAIFKIMTDTIPIMADSLSEIFFHIPYTYDFNDIWGDINWEDMFVTKLLVTHKGNCHSLPFLYKMIAEQFGINTYLALAPNHIYIKTYSEDFGWYNTELTSGTFPLDSWLVASGYIHLTAIQNGVYMKALDNRQSLAICFTDLAEGFKRKTKKAEDDFIIDCCDTALFYYPHYVNAMILKAETLKAKYEILTSKESKTDFEQTQAKELYNRMEQIYNEVYQLGYRSMPKEMYVKWVQSLQLESEKYINKSININSK